MVAPMHHEFLKALWPRMQQAYPPPWQVLPNGHRQRHTVMVVDANGKRIQVMGPRQAEYFCRLAEGLPTRQYRAFVDFFLTRICDELKKEEGTKNLKDWRVEGCYLISAKGAKVAELSSPFRANKLLEWARQINAEFLSCGESED